MKRLPLLCALAALGCDGLDPQDHPASCTGSKCPLAACPQLSRTALVLTTTFETGGLDAFSLDGELVIDKNRLVVSPDAALRQVAGRGVVLNRGEASNLLLVGEGPSVCAQVALPSCNPHDVVLLDDGRLLVSCYDATTLQVVDLERNTAELTVDLSALADEDGIPEMDQMVRIGSNAYLTVQRIDRNTWAPSGPGLVAVIDLATLRLVDTDASTSALDAWELPLPNPYTRLSATPEGTMLVGCAGNMLDQSQMGIVELDPGTGESGVLFYGSSLDGVPIDLRVDEGVAFALISSPNGWAPDEMRVVRLGESPDILHATPDFSLAGIAAGEGRIFVGDRTDGPGAGLWVVNLVASTASGPFATGLLPWEVELFPARP